eukprot:6184381-Pleurochrysis_carterae.AAC.3
MLAQSKPAMRKSACDTTKHWSLRASQLANVIVRNSSLSELRNQLYCSAMSDDTYIVYSIIVLLDFVINV